MLTNRIKQLYYRLSRGDNALHDAIIHHDLAEAQLAKDPTLNQPNSLGYAPKELALLLNRTEWYSPLGIQQTHRIKVVQKEKHLAESLTQEQFEKLFAIPYLTHMTFTGYDLLKIVYSQRPWLFRFGILGMERDPNYVHYVDRIFQGKVANVTVAWIDDVLGYGVFTNEHLNKGSFVGAYTGIVRPLSKQNPDHNVYCIHYPTRFWSHDIFVVDAGRGGNEMRFLNHSDTPNLSLECLLNRGILHFFFRTNQPVSKGSHLTFDYGSAFWRHRIDKKKIPF